MAALKASVLILNSPRTTRRLTTCYRGRWSGRNPRIRRHRRKRPHRAPAPSAVHSRVPSATKRPHSGLRLLRGVPTSILYDNTKLAVTRILAEEPAEDAGLRRVAEPLSVCRQVRTPGQGQRQRQRRGLGGLRAAQLLAPVPRFASWEALNAHLREQCRQRREQRVRGEPETIGERFARDRAALLPLPVSEYEACEKRVARVKSMSPVRDRTNYDAAPTEYGHRDVLVKGYVHEVVIVCGSQVVARHRRSYRGASERSGTGGPELVKVPPTKVPTMWRLRREYISIRRPLAYKPPVAGCCARTRNSGCGLFSQDLPYLFKVVQVVPGDLRPQVADGHRTALSVKRSLQNSRAPVTLFFACAFACIIPATQFP